MSTYTFLFAWFEASPEGRKFARDKFAENSEARFPERMIAEVSQLGHEAQKLLRQQHQPLVGQDPSPPKSFQSQAELAQMTTKLAAYFDQARVKWQ